MAKKKWLTEDDLEDFLEEADMTLPDWLDSFLTWIDYYDPGPKKPVAFKFMGRTMAVYLPLWVIDLIEESAQEEGCSRSKWMEGAVLIAVLLRAKAKKVYGMDGSSMTKTMAATKKFKAAKELRDLEDLMHIVDDDIRFWLEQMRSDPVAQAIQILFDSLEATKNKDLRLAKLRYVLSHDEWLQAGISLLRVTDHPKFHYFQALWDGWTTLVKV